MNITSEFIYKLMEMGEDEKVEFKTAKNSFPKDGLETISAFANTDGGLLILGVEEVEFQSFKLAGVNNPEKIKNDFFNMMNNKQKISRNIFTNKDFLIYNMLVDKEELSLIIINVKKESYKNKPIFLHENPYQAYIRLGSGDIQCDIEDVNSMIRDANNDPYDSTKIKNFTIEDLDLKTIESYRWKFQELNPDHPFNKLSHEEFLIKIKALTQDRDSNKKSIVPTVAGLLVFGKHESIKEHIPHYNIEYINRSKTNSNLSYIDRLIYDGSWGEDNLYNFFNHVIEKLYSTLNNNSDILDDSITRISNSKMRIAIREALVNSIIHCDFMAREGVYIIRYSDRIIFRNGGTLRISKEDFFSGGHSDPRNYFIQEIFRLINLCEKAGSGIPKIMDAVKENKYKYPEIQVAINSFEFTLWDTSLIENLNLSNDIEESLIKLVIANKRITINGASKELKIHRNTATKYLNSLVDKKILEKFKIGRVYHYMFSHEEHFDKYNMLNSMYTIIEEIRRN